MRRSGLFGGAPPSRLACERFADSGYLRRHVCECHGRTERLPGGRIALESDLLPHWTPRDQRARGTCTAFGAAAAMELFLARQGRREDLSEQFLYHRMRVAQPGLGQGVPGEETGATRLAQAGAVLKGDGICPEHMAPYHNALPPGVPLEGQAPTAEALAQAALLRHPAFRHDLLTDGPAGFGNRPLSDLFVDLLAQGSPVAVGLPVFEHESGETNWTLTRALTSGVVPCPDDAGAPELRMLMDGGHVVCLTGFQPDPDEPRGGWFIFRNSWGADFGTSVYGPPRPGPRIPARGFGAMSATYVDKYVWEYLAPLDETPCG